MLAEKIRLFPLFSAFYGLNTSILPGMEPRFWTFRDLINVLYAPYRLAASWKIKGAKCNMGLPIWTIAAAGGANDA